MKSLWDAHNGDPTLRSSRECVGSQTFQCSLFLCNLPSVLVPQVSYSLPKPFQSLLRLYKVLPAFFAHLFCFYNRNLFRERCSSLPLLHWIYIVFQHLFFLSLLFCFSFNSLDCIPFFSSTSLYFFFNFYAMHQKAVDNVKCMASTCSPFWGTSLTSLSNYLECMYMCAFVVNMHYFLQTIQFLNI